MRLVYLAHKIRDNGLWAHYQNIRNAEQIAMDLSQMGAAVICPGKNNENFDGALPDGFLLEADLVILRRCDAVVMAPDWKTSVGAQGEYQEALNRGMPVFFWATDHDRIREFIES